MLNGLIKDGKAKYYIPEGKNRGIVFRGKEVYKRIQV